MRSIAAAIVDHPGSSLSFGLTESLASEAIM